MLQFEEQINKRALSLFILFIHNPDAGGIVTAMHPFVGHRRRTAHMGAISPLLTGSLFLYWRPSEAMPFQKRGTGAIMVKQSVSP